MEKSCFILIGILLALPGWSYAQSVPPPPSPIIETELRDNDIRMRSIELERIKRDAAKITTEEPTTEQKVRFAKTKENFEEIQKLQDSIIRAYTTGEKINYAKISKSAARIEERSLWLNENLFGAEPDVRDRNEAKEETDRKSVRDLIIQLDGAIGNFVTSPVFQNTKVVDPKVSKEAQIELTKIMKLCRTLSIEAGRLR